jgi:peroxiredoxin
MKYFITVFLALWALALSAQKTTVALDFPQLGGATAWLYTFSGSRVDSINVTLDKSGKATAVLSQNDYRGFSYLYIPDKGGGEFILAEPRVQVSCADEQFNSGMLRFPQSVENDFVRYVMEKQAYLSAQQEWLQAGDYFGNEEDSEFNMLFNKMLERNKTALQQIEDTVKHSPLYSARFIELMQFMQRMYNALQTFNQSKGEFPSLIAEFENTLNINALYHSGNLWTDVHSYYPSLFYGANSDSVQIAYARSICRAMERLEEPVLTAFLSTALTECERTYRPKAQEVMLGDFIMRHPNLPISDTKVKRMLGALSLNQGSPAPPVAGLQTPLAQPTILIFFDSNCDHCLHEVKALINNYEQFTAKGYRVVSIAGDIQPVNYQSISVTFPWNEADRLCDFQGTDGENFRSYGVIGTPTIFVVDNKGLIVGRYAQISEIIMNNE